MFLKLLIPSTILNPEHTLLINVNNIAYLTQEKGDEHTSITFAFQGRAMNEKKPVRMDVPFSLDELEKLIMGVVK